MKARLIRFEFAGNFYKQTRNYRWIQISTCFYHFRFQCYDFSRRHFIWFFLNNLLRKILKWAWVDFKHSRFVCTLLLSWMISCSDIYLKQWEEISLLSSMIDSTFSIPIQCTTLRPYFWSQSPIRLLLIDDWILCGFAQIA